MRIDSHQHYFAIMKGKMGELHAARDLAVDVLERTTFVWEIPQQPYNHETETFGKSIDSHITAFSKRLHEACPNETNCFIDCRLLGSASRLETGEIPLAAVLRQCADLGAHPSIGDEPTETEIAVVRSHLAKPGAEVLLRLSPRTFAKIGFAARLNSLIQNIGAEPSRYHLFLDFEQLSPEADASPQAFSAYSAIAALPSVADWLSFSIVGASVPKSLPSASTSPRLLPRIEWQIWQEVIANLDGAARLPSFGDYGVSSRDIDELDPRLITVSANIRYTSTDGVWIFKGRSLKRYSFEQFRELSQALVRNLAYTGPDYSWGDRYINDCANGQVGTGNTTTWRRVGTNHHVSFVARQVSGQSSAQQR